ncbi:MAG TPA: C-GCAxxG-C-C family protein [Prolixibacteraceae bacterium]|nr:C-GCAxxG-C-C family protein [Prolixibacteraceae bacterium]
MTKPEIAGNYFDNNFNCSQSVLAAFAPDLGISLNDSLKVSCAFGGGMGKQQLTCGAVTGALMVLGLKFGKALDDNDEKKQETYALTRKFCDAFKDKFGSMNCLELLQNLDMNDPADNALIHDLGLHESHCTRFVKEAVELVELISTEHDQKTMV